MKSPGAGTHRGSLKLEALPDRAPVGDAMCPKDAPARPGAAINLSREDWDMIWLNALNIAAGIQGRGQYLPPHRVPRVVAEKLRDGRWPPGWREPARCIAIVMLGGRLS